MKGKWQPMSVFGQSRSKKKLSSTSMHLYDSDTSFYFYTSILYGHTVQITAEFVFYNIEYYHLTTNMKHDTLKKKSPSYACSLIINQHYVHFCTSISTTQSELRH